MKPLCLLLFVLCLVHQASAQLGHRDFILSTSVTGLAVQRYNLGAEHIVQKQATHRLGFKLNLGITRSEINGIQLQGMDASFECRLYTQLLLPAGWNEYGGLRLDYGRFKAKSQPVQQANYVFGGLSLGVQPVVAKRFAINLGTDLGYIRNGPGNNTIAYPEVAPGRYFDDGFGILLHAGIGYRF